jgi:hypothetical protein
MRPCLQNRRVIKVLAGKTWEAVMRHRVYSCPELPDWEFTLGATALILMKGAAGARVPLEVVAVEKFVPDVASQLEALAEPFRTRARSYLAEVDGNREIIPPKTTHRFYFLSDEPWPNWLQDLTTPEQCPDLEWSAIRSICVEPSRFFEWPQVGELLWPGCTRGNDQQQHSYPPDIVQRLLKLGIHRPDTRNNGPAIMAFLAAGGRRPTWGDEGWHIHHVYDGTERVPKHPAPVPHAASQGHLFTHSGGLVAAHPVAHHLAHQSKLLKWLLRREAFLRFGFDPMGVFGQS